MNKREAKWLADIEAVKAAGGIKSLQADHKIIAAIIRDLTVQNYLSKDDERKAHEQARRIARKARELEIAVPKGY